MNPRTQALLEKVQSWPEEDQEELADVAREIESRRTGIYRLSDDERAAIQKGVDDALRGDFVPDDEMEEFFKFHRSVAEGRC
jgi:predicted transcriptional regulator